MLRKNSLRRTERGEMHIRDVHGSPRGESRRRMEVLAGPAYVVRRIRGEAFEIDQHSPSSTQASNISKANGVLNHISLAATMS